MKLSALVSLPAALLLAFPVLAHHGVAGVGGAALEGPGAPVESASSSTLPEGKTLVFLKLDHAAFKTFNPDPAQPESDYSQFWMAGIGYGFTPWFSAYLFFPHHAKVDEPGGFNSRGWADVSLMGQIGFKYDQGFSLTPANESLDDLEDWHFTVFGGATLPSGNPNLRDSSGVIDPGKSTGFGKPAYTLGMTASKMIMPRLTFNAEASQLMFQEYTYADNSRMKFGAERRLNASLAYRLWSDAGRRMRVDGVIEVQHLTLGRDRSNGEYEAATGGKILYALPGVRFYWDKASLALGVKKPVSTWLNEADQQQGGEGTEKYRVIMSFSYLF